MKLLLIILAFITSSAFYAQEIDQRLIENHSDTIYRIHKQKHNYYQYLRYELDFSYTLKSKDELNKEQIKNALNAEVFKNKNGEKISKKDIVQGTFNFKSFGVKLSTEEETIIQLDKNTYLIFISRRKLGENFQTSPYYTK